MITRRKFLTIPAIGVASLVLPSLLIGCSDGADDSTGTTDEYASITVFYFDTVIEIQADCDQELLEKVEERLAYFENTLSKTVEGSDIYTINHAGGAATQVQPETAEIIEQALYYSEISQGLFDITIGGVIDLWDFLEGVIPDKEELTEALTHVNYRNVELSGQTVTVADPQTKLDLGGIAKGYIADDIAAFLRENGCESAFINLGGNVYALGSKADGSSWRIGLQDPNSARGAIIGAVAAKDKSVVTSGINERSFEKDGVSYHHLIDPSTGMPAQNGLASATIVSDLSIDGDAFTTITFLMGKEKAEMFLESHPESQWLFVDAEGEISNSLDMEVELF